MTFCRQIATVLVLLAALPLAAETRVPESPAEITLSFSPVVRRAAPAVVNIFATRMVAEGASPFANDPFFRDFFGMFDRMMPRSQNSLGSGVIVHPDGIVVSNHHVVGNATEIRIVLADRREFTGEILLSDPEADLAVIRLEGAGELPALEFADSESAEVGDLVLAIGNPFGVGQTVTSGIVSGLARSASGQGRGAGYFIQTDAPINPGNSGGALVDMDGRLLGINTSILTRSGGSNGVGFAIPASIVRQYVSQARSGSDRFVAPWSGLVAQPVDTAVAEALGLDRPEGVIVAQLHPESPFAEAGLSVGDLLLSIAGLPVNTPAELDARLTALGLGAEVDVAWLRGGRRRTAQLTLTPAPGGDSKVVRLSANTIFRGLALADLSPRLIDDLGLPLDAEWVAVVAVTGPSVRSGLEPGDIVRIVNGHRIRRVADSVDLLSTPSPIWDLEFVRSGRLMRLRFRG